MPMNLIIHGGTKKVSQTFLGALTLWIECQRCVTVDCSITIEIIVIMARYITVLKRAIERGLRSIRAFENRIEKIA